MGLRAVDQVVEDVARNSKAPPERRRCRDGDRAYARYRAALRCGRLGKNACGIAETELQKFAFGRSRRTALRIRGEVGKDVMQAVILCGGRGTRLHEETSLKPKPMVPIGNHPILWHLMRRYRAYGIRKFVLCLGYKGEVIRDYFLNFRHYNADLEVDLASGAVTLLADHDVDWQVRLVDTGLAALTGARIRRVTPHIDSPRFFATYGDGLADIDLDQLLQFHERQGKLVTVTAVRPPSRFGELLVEGALVRRFSEKPQTGAGWINGGFFVIEQAALASFPDREELSLEADVLEDMAARGQLAVYKHEGFWQCMDTYREMQLLNEIWASGNVPWAKL
jgi:glucose-1-phosphate cytidylyltransferase